MSSDDLAKWSCRAKPGMPLFDGPQDVRDTFIRSHGIDWTASYIDPATWIAQSRTIVAATTTAYLRIAQQASIICGRMGVNVRGPQTGMQLMAAE